MDDHHTRNMDRRSKVIPHYLTPTYCYDDVNQVIPHCLTPTYCYDDVNHVRKWPPLKQNLHQKAGL